MTKRAERKQTQTVWVVEASRSLERWQNPIKTDGFTTRKAAKERMKLYAANYPNVIMRVVPYDRRIRKG